MADEEQTKNERQKSKIPLMIGVVLMLVLGGGSFFAVYSGMLFGHDPVSEGAVEYAVEDVEVEPLPDVTYIPIEPLIVNLATDSGSPKHLRFHAQIEVPAKFEEDVKALVPRIVDILNGYLRAVDVEELESPSALIQLRSQMLRRMKIAAGDQRVNDVLIMEFVIN
ncbi:flagellar basal body-associated FliL family protein [Celeribacter sp.]|uniref:flagellar basal body-associated FliL family protein n=1 Tax=Celeribacter sp. TaxID=1890673 RepID=UPI003A8ECD60